MIYVLSPNGALKYATIEEIKSAHPKCGECKYAASATLPYCMKRGMNTRLIVDPQTDYCENHEPKE